MDKSVILSIESVSKHFGITQALKNVSFNVKKGEVHALMGENGAGKSTLVKIISGALQKDTGKILYFDKELNSKNPQQSRKLGINVVYQELSLIQSLTVGENIHAASFPMNKFKFMNIREIGKDAYNLLQEYNIDVKKYIKELGVGAQQIVEIAGAVSRNCSLLILDEPTAALTISEAERLFFIINKLKDNGVTIIYISHKIDEIFKIADRCTVLKDGEFIGTVDIQNCTENLLINMMVGRDIKEMFPKKSGKQDNIVLDVEDVSGKGFKNISFKLYEGEVLGFAGLAGSGRTELFTSIFGYEQIYSGSVKIMGKQSKIKNPHGAIKNGIGYLPEDRKQVGIFTDMSIKENVVASNIDKLSGKFFVNSKVMNSLTNEMKDKLQIKFNKYTDKISALSGGNQQKVLLARWLLVNPKILIVDEPTRGIDIGAKHEIYLILRRIAEEGVGVIMISSETPEILGMSDRIVVMYRSRIHALLEKNECDISRLGNAIVGM